MERSPKEQKTWPVSVSVTFQLSIAVGVYCVFVNCTPVVIALIYKRNGWLGVKHQITYPVVSYLLKLLPWSSKVDADLSLA